MEHPCANSVCRRKLKEYRESTTKLFDDIESLEDDLKERDLFAQKVVQQRNGYKEEVFLLKKKNDELLKDGDDLPEKVNQLEEDTDDGDEMLEMAHTRERKLKAELEELRIKVVQIEEMKRKQEVSNKIIKVLQVDKETLKNQMKEYRTAFGNKENVAQMEMKELQNKIDEMKQTNKEKEEYLLNLNDRENVAQQEIKELHFEIQKVIKTNEEKDELQKNLLYEQFKLEEKLRQMYYKKNGDMYAIPNEFDHPKVEYDASTVKSLEEELEVCRIVRKF